MRRARNRLFTEEQEKFIRDHAKGLYNKELADLVNKKFGLSITTSQVRAYKKNHKISSGKSLSLLRNLRKTSV